MENSIDSWLLSIQWNHIAFLFLELAACAIHPIPGNYSFAWRLHTSYDAEPVVVNFPVDVLLSLPMFLRIYLLWRVFMINVKLFSPILKSMGKINGVQINTYFMVRSLIEYYPLKILIIYNLILFFAASWCLRITEG